MTDPIRWGILGTGNIAKAFVEGLAVLPDAQVTAVGSRTARSANQFADEHGIARRHPSYEDLAADASVDVVYVATPHVFHLENMQLCLKAGKAVLCEKPFTINAAQAAAAIQFAREQHLFLMEAMWTRFMPLIVKLREMLGEGIIGEPQMLVAGLATIPSSDPASYFFKPELGGGILLDGGVYPISLSYRLFGPPSRIASMGKIGPSGVDEQDAVVLGYEDGRLAVLYFSFRTRIAPSFALYGSRGRIQVHPPLFKPTTMTLSRDGEPDKVMEFPFGGNGLNLEATEVMRCLREGKTESEVIPLDETLAIMKTADAVRAQWGLRYPVEQGREQ